MRRRITPVLIRNRLKSILKLSLVICLIWGGFKAYDYLFIIRFVECETHEHNQCPQAVQAELSRVIGENLLTLPQHELTEKILQSSVAYENLDLTKKLPAKLSAKLKQAQAIALLQTSSQSAYVEVLDNLSLSEAVSDKTGELEIIQVISPIQFKLGEPISEPWLMDGMRLFQKIKQNFLVHQSYSIATDSAKLQLNDDIQVIFNPEKDPVTQITALQIIMKNNLDPTPTEIDLRFDKPILRD